MSGVLDAAELQQELDAVVVTASRVVEKVKETPATLNIVASDELEDIKFKNPSEVLNRLPGIYTHDFGGESELTSIRVPTHFTNGYTVVLVDGIPTSSYGSGSSGQISELNNRNIDRIEVVKGPSSALYGSNAIGGIINIITRDPSPGSEVNVWGEYGDDEQYSGGVSASGSGRKLSYNLDLNYKDSEGWRDHSAIDKKAGTAKIQFPPTESSLLGVKIDLLSMVDESGGSLDEADFEADWQHSYYTFNETTLDKSVATLTYNYFLEDSEIKAVLSYKKIDHTTLPNYNIRQITYGPPPAFGGHNGDYHGYFNDIQGNDSNFQLIYSRDMAPWRSKLIIGVDAEYGETETDQDNLEITWDPAEKLYTSYSFLSDNKWYDITTEVASPYLQLAASPLERLRITVGGRYDNVTYEVDDKLDPTPSGASGDKDFSEFSPKIGATYEISRDLNVYTSFSKGFVVPTTSQLFTSQGSNDMLEPEKAKNYEVGFRSFFLDRKVGFDVAAYSMEITDKIYSSSYGQPYTNVAETSMEGIETVLALRPVEMVSLSCAYTYTHNKFEVFGTSSGNTLPRSPDHHLNVRLTLMPFTGFQAEIEVDDVSSQYADDANLVSYSRPTLVNLRTSYDWNDVSLWAHVLNLTDEQYATYVSGTYGDIGYYSGKPLTFFAGLSYRFGGDKK